jgi:hypothetical protein
MITILLASGQTMRCQSGEHIAFPYRDCAVQGRTVPRDKQEYERCWAAQPGMFVVRDDDVADRIVEIR